MNFIFISPNFPHTYWHFCDRLHKNGVNVLGIGDAPYEHLDLNLRQSLTEYYKVSSLENYDEVYKAVAFFTYKYGRIDWLESNNEYWLEQDAKLRTDFNIRTGVQADQVVSFKSKWEMKALYRMADVPSARCARVTTLAKARDFLKETGYPVIVKPEIGVGATRTWKIENEQQLSEFFKEKPEIPYVMEEFVVGDICSYDAITDSQCRPLFESMTVWPPVMDIVNEQLDLMYYTAAEMPAQLRERGQATLKAFGVASRFVHLEFFRLKEAKAGLGDEGDFIGLEVNMRPAGGYTPDMMNWAHNTDVYQIWADMVTEDRRIVPESERHYYCAYASRRDVYRYVHTHEEILQRYGEQMMMCERMPEMMVPQMGNQMYTIRANSLAETEQFVQFVHQKA
ncbi:MAG: ATP-grasp domain-containing protein [Paludibacteraceae bacterium]|nr:ATP-grasp domain-containing protein [Paludibacteraceae bacterium]